MMEKTNGRKRTTNGSPTGDQVRSLAEEDGEDSDWGEIDADDLQELKEAIKEEMDEWLEAVDG